MKWILMGALLALIVLYPAAASLLLAGLGTVAVAAAGQPAVWAFLAGVLAWPRLAARVRRWAR